MTPTTPCPTPADYEAMLLGRVADARAAELEEHVGGCAACQRVLDGLAVETRLTAALRAGPEVAADLTSDPGVGAMVARLEDMASQFTPAGFDLSMSGDPTASPDGPALDPTELPRMGTYRVVRLLGAGGMGLVYLAEDEALRRPVAVKVLRPRLARHTRAREGFLREARAMAALKHDNVVTVFQVGEAAGPGDQPVPFLAMELLEGESLADWLRREGAVPAPWAIRLGRQAAGGLAAAHARGVIHRDIKPGNLWLEAPPGWADLPPGQRPPLPAVARLKVLDFGLAQPVGEDGAGTSRLVLGTPAYMPPEQAGGREVDYRADLFSLGVVLYELVTGRQPFPREARRAALTYPAPPPVADLAPDTPPVLARLIHRLLAPDPGDRPGSAREVEREVGALGFPRSGDTVALAGDATRPVPTRRRRSLARAGAGLAAAVVVGVGVWAAIPRQPVPPPPSDPPEPAAPQEPEPRVVLAPAPTAAPDPADIPGPPDEAWVKTVAALPPEQHTRAVILKLRELNPDFDGKVSRLALSDGKVTEFGVLTDSVADIRPVRAFPSLRHLSVVGTEPGKGKVTDLSPIRGLPLTTLNIWQNPQLADLSPARGMQLTILQAGDTAIEDLSPLEGMPLDLVAVNNCRVKDLSPVRSMPKIRYVRCDGCPLDGLEPLVGSKLRELRFTFNRARGDAEVLDQLTGLAVINGLPASDFRRRNPARN